MGQSGPIRSWEGDRGGLAVHVWVAAAQAEDGRAASPFCALVRGGCMTHRIRVTINGAGRSDEVEPRLLLVHYLREVVGLTGTHVGCDTSQCGACTILIDGAAVKSCTQFAVQADGRELTTIEGLAHNGELHPLQKAFWDEHGLQCGFCTPGMIMTAVDILSNNPRPTEDEIKRGLEGNLCRCTGYVNIVKAVKVASDAMSQSGAAPTATGGA